MKTGIIFDMDGTLWDSSKEVCAAWNEVIKRRGAYISLSVNDMRSLMGKSMDDIKNEVFKDLPEDERDVIMSECISYENEYIKKNGAALYPLLEETLQTLQQSYPLYIVSNCQSGYIEAFLSHYSLGKYFSDFKCYGDNGLDKSENIKLIAKRNYLDRYYYVGDTKLDYDSCVKAGGRFIHAAYGFGSVPESTSYIDSLSDLPNFLYQNDDKMQKIKVAEYTIPEIKKFLDMTSHMYDLVRIVDPDECRIIDVSEDKITYGSLCYEVWDSSHRCKDCSSYRACMAGHRGEKNELQKGDLYHIQSNPIQIVLDNNTSLPCVIEFVTKRPATVEERSLLTDRRLEDEMAFTSTTDALTGLLNRESFYLNARKLLQKYPGRTFLMCVADICQFKLVNSLFGREKANDILIRIANLFIKYQRDEVLYARIQADQFAIFLPKDVYDEDIVMSSLETVSGLLSDSAYTLKMQMGIYEVDDPDIAVNIMFDRAMTALSTIHDNDMETIARFNDSLLQRILNRQKVISAFEGALSAGEFNIFLQPQVIGSGRVEGGEALCRWIRPDGSIVPPMDFIPVLEHVGLIVKLDTYVWELAAKQLAAWKNTEFEKYYISVNISPMDFYYIDVYKCFTDLIEKYGLSREKLKLEITESVLMSDEEAQLKKVKNLKKSGFYLEIDDFGKGYSSLSLLKDMEADVLKIDMGFLRETEHVERSRNILRSIIEMSNKLGMKVITEGVEKESQLKMLNDMGCNMYQGFYFAKPMPIPDFEKYAREHQ